MNGGYFAVESPARERRAVAVCLGARPDNTVSTIPLCAACAEETPNARPLLAGDRIQWCEGGCSPW